MPIMTLKQARAQALARFDFERAEKIYKMLDWKWQGAVPDVAAIRETAEKLLDSVLSMAASRPCSSATGGLRARIKQGNMEAWEVTLEFVVQAGVSDDFLEPPRETP